MNVLLFVADDMRLDHMTYMPNVRNLIQAQGTRFTDARCNTPLCQPNRVGLVTGQLSRDHGDLTVGITDFVWDDYDNDMAAWLDTAGVRCGFFGKYTNFTDNLSQGITRPAGWTTWREYAGRSLDVDPPPITNVDFDIMGDAPPKTRVAGTLMNDYFTDEVITFVGGTEPWFAFLSFPSPHSPFWADPQDLHAWPHVIRPIVDEVDVSDKPSWIQSLPALTNADREAIQADVRGRLRELVSVDRAIGAVIAHLDTAGVLDDTIVIFTSDNGVHEGEHRRTGAATKAGPYEVGLRVPMVARGPGFPVGLTVEAPVYPTQDVTATLVEVFSATPTVADQAGTSLRTIAATPAAYDDRILLHECANGYPTTGDGITTGPNHSTLGYRKLYRYPSYRADPDGPYVYEMYDLDTDPDELANVANVSARLAERNTLEAELLALRLA